MKLLFLCSILLVSAFAPAGAQVRELDLRYLSVEEAMSMVAPLLDADEGLTQMSGRVFLNSGSTTYAQVRQLLKKVDVAPAVYQLSVRQGTNGGSEYRPRVGLAGGGERRLDVTAGKVVFVETAKALYELGVAPGQGFRRQRTEPVGTLGRRGFFVMVRVDGTAVMVRSSAETVVPALESQVSTDDADLIYAATGHMGEWVTLGPTPAFRPGSRLSVKPSGSAMRWQVRVAQP